jgi:DNA-binding transcriptional LysR family regulator
MFENLFAQSGLSLERLKTFREIVAVGGITAAAGNDSNRQSQYSRQLKELERYFGVELLKRGRGPVELTDAGKRLYGIVGHTLRALEEFRALVSAPLGKLDFCLFVPAAQLPANQRLKLKSDILSHLPLATLEGSPGIRQAIDQEAQRIGIKLNVRLRFSSYPQLAQAVQNLGVAAIMPKLATASFEGPDVRAVPLPFLRDLSRQVSLVWNRKMAEVRPAIAKYSRLLPAMFRMDEC